MIHEKYLPKVSEKKREQLEKQIMSLKTSPRTRLSPLPSPTEDLYKLDRKKIVWAENPLKPKPEPKREFKVIDYLK